MPWKKEWAWEDADKSTKYKKDKRSKYTELDMCPWVCAQPGCTQTKNWNCYTKCKSCGAARITPPLTQLPTQQSPVDWESKYKELAAQVKKGPPTGDAAATPVEPDPDSDSDTDTDNEAETHAKFHTDLEKVIFQFEDMGKAIPELEVIKKLLNVTKTTDKPILTNNEIETEITKEQKLMEELDESLQTQRITIRQQKGTLEALEKKLAESEDRFKEARSRKEKWLSERLDRHQREQNNREPDDATWEKQAAQRKKEKKQAQKQAAEGKQRLAGSVPNLLQALDALREAAVRSPATTPPEPTPTTPVVDVDMLAAEELKRKKEQEARAAKRAAKATGATSAQASSSPAAGPGEDR